jgi:aminoglycoside 6'-N-acetyltransferase
MYDVLADPALYRYIDRAPPASVAALRDLYLRLERRRSPDGRQAWLNWIVRPLDGDPIGFVQATVDPSIAWIAYMFAPSAWGRGHATSACRSMIAFLQERYPVERFGATVEMDNERSIRLLERLGFRRCDPPSGMTLSPTERLFTYPHGHE